MICFRGLVATALRGQRRLRRGDDDITLAAGNVVLHFRELQLIKKRSTAVIGDRAIRVINVVQMKSTCSITAALIDRIVLANVLLLLVRVFAAVFRLPVPLMLRPRIVLAVAPPRRLAPPAEAKPCRGASRRSLQRSRASARDDPDPPDFTKPVPESEEVPPG